jgi:Zn-dependent M16 (insulinase) family peptidase
VGDFSAVTLYLNHLGRAMGARFRHRPTGMETDLLFFASVPQVSITFKTLSRDDKGIPHALEHLVLGKGAKGKRFNMLVGMSIGEYTAGTYSDLTGYMLNTAAGMEDFYRLLEAYLDTLLHPDFTDEEVRREVYNPEVQGDAAAGTLSIEEKGTVYNEMVSGMEKPDLAGWFELSRLSFGPEHPLARNFAGAPDAMRTATVPEVRAFHAAHYRVGPGMSVAVALPAGEDPFAFLRRFGGVLSRVSGADGPVPAAVQVPPFAPAAEGVTSIGRYPSTEADSPQDVHLAFRPLPSLSAEDALGLGVLLDLLAGGETSFLHKDTVDRSARKEDLGVVSGGAFLDDPPTNMACVSFSGVPADRVSEEHLQKLRAAVTGRVAWIAGLKPGSPELAEVAVKAASLISSRRRQLLKFMDNPPRFGMRSGGVAWHKYLERLNASRGGFRRSVPQTKAFDLLLGSIRAGGNVWAGIAAKGGLLARPVAVSLRPDAGLLERQRTEKAARVARLESEALARYGGKDLQSALWKMKDASSLAALEIEERDKRVERASFVKDPPLTLDSELVVRRRELPGIGNATSSGVGDSPFTEMGIFFDLSGVPSEYHLYLPLLADTLTGVGVTAADGSALDYAAMIERYRSEIYELSSSVAANPRTRRLELSLLAASSSRPEVAKAVEWLESCLLRNSLGPASRSRLIDMARERVQSLRSMTQQREEYWVREPASAYLYQDQPAWMSVRSPFTKLRHLDRLRWMLEDPSKEELASMRAGLAAVAAAGRTKTKKEALAAIANLPPELAEGLRWDLGNLPEESWRTDLAGLAEGLSSDLGVGSAVVIDRLMELRALVLKKGRVRLSLTGSEPAMDAALGLLAGLLGKLPPADAPGPEPGPRAVVLERLAGRDPSVLRGPRPVHVALVNDGTKSGVFVLSARAPSYRDRGDGDLVDFLAANVLGGSAGHSLFMRTWAEGLAYGNGVGSSLLNGRIGYYAERCPSLVATMGFAVSVASGTALDSPFFVEYALANSFGDYRGAEDFATRGYAMSANMADGITSEVVRDFKSALMAKAREPGALEAVRSRLVPTLGRVLVGLGPRAADAPEASAFVIGPTPLLDDYEAYLKAHGEADRLVRLYPRDFWLAP